MLRAIIFLASQDSIDASFAWVEGWNLARERARTIEAMASDEDTLRAAEPERFERESDGSITVTVHQVVSDARTGEVQTDTHVLHRYRLEDGLIVCMDALDAAA